MLHVRQPQAKIYINYRTPYKVKTCVKNVNQIYRYRSSEYVFPKIDVAKILQTIKTYK